MRWIVIAMYAQPLRLALSFDMYFSLSLLPSPSSTRKPLSSSSSCVGGFRDSIFAPCREWEIVFLAAFHHHRASQRRQRWWRRRGDVSGKRINRASHPTFAATSIRFAFFLFLLVERRPENVSPWRNNKRKSRRCASNIPFAYGGIEK